jgi:hypothetical protein
MMFTNDWQPATGCYGNMLKSWKSLLNQRLPGMAEVPVPPGAVQVRIR